MTVLVTPYQNKRFMNQHFEKVLMIRTDAKDRNCRTSQFLQSQRSNIKSSFKNSENNNDEKSRPMKT